MYTKIFKLSTTKKAHSAIIKSLCRQDNMEVLSIHKLGYIPGMAVYEVKVSRITTGCDICNNDMIDDDYCRFCGRKVRL